MSETSPTIEPTPAPVAARSAEDASWRSRAGFIVRVVQLRLRFVLLLAALAAVLLGWQQLQRLWDRAHDWWSAAPLAAGGVSSDTEYFCPMCPGVVTQWPEKCPVCKMPLVRRKKGEATLLPQGVLARMQVSPYRVQLAGIATTVAQYRTLRVERTERAEKDSRDATADGGELALINVAELEPFRSQPRRPPALTKDDARALYQCSDHPDFLYTRDGRCPYDERKLDHVLLRDDQRVEFWCPAHRDSRATVAGGCEACGNRSRIPRIVTYLPEGQVLAIPVTAVVQTPRSPVVYVERMPGMFDGVPVQLGPRCGDFYPVAAGLVQGDRVATAGAFLLDAESRLNAGVASTYFGAGSVAANTDSRDARSAGADSPEQLLRALKLSEIDRAWAEWQRVCPVTQLPLGGMGELDRVSVRGRTIFLCCEACRDSIDPASLDQPPSPPLKQP